MNCTAAVLLPVAAALLCLAGCDPAVKSRYQPTSVNEVFGAFSGVSGVDDEVHELPAPPPAVGAIDIDKRRCRPPGVLMKPTDMVAWSPAGSRVVRADPSLIEGMYEPPLPSPPPGPAHRISSWNPHEDPGVKERISTPPYSPRLEPGRSIYGGSVTPMGAYRRDTYSWCEDAPNRR